MAFQRGAGERGQPVADCQRRADGTLGVVLVCLGQAEHGHHRVAAELLDRAAAALDLESRELEEVAHDAAHDLGIEPFAH